MGSRTKEEKLIVAKELAVALAPYLWSRSWGFGLNMYFDDVHVDYREMNSYIFSEEQSEDREYVLSRFDEDCIEQGEIKDEKYQTYKEILAIDPDIEIYVSCEQEIYEQLYLYIWDGQPSGKGIIDRINAVLDDHNMVLNLQDYAIVLYDKNR